MSAGFAPPASAPGTPGGLGAAAPGDSARRAGQAAGAAESLGLGLACFFALAAFCGIQYATLLLHPPLLRVLGVALAATAFGGALATGARVGVPRPLRVAGGFALALLALALSLVAAGVPLSLLAPGRWHMLGHEVDRGLNGLAGWLWPYRGDSRWSQITVLALLAPVQVAAAAACFWPRAGGGTRDGRARAVGLGLLLALLVTGLANQTSPAWRVEGLGLLLLLAAWLWLPRLSGAVAGRAAGWLAAAALAALVIAPALDAGRPLIDFRAWNPIPATARFEWNQTYGPIPWSRSDATMFEIAEPHPRLLRVTTLDRFDGVRFLRTPSPPADPLADLPLQRRASGGFVSATVAIAGLRSPLLVSGGGEPLRVHWLARKVSTAHPAGDGTITLSPPPVAGARYEVLSYAPQPGGATLRRAPAGYPAVYLPYARFDLPPPLAGRPSASGPAPEAPAGVPPAAPAGAPAPGRTPSSGPRTGRRIATSPYGPAFALARRLARGAPTAYDVATRIERYLLTNYTYDEHPPRARYPLEAFLFGSRRGYCQQFSGAMTLLLRMDGIAARVAAGFRPRDFDAATGHATVSPLDAHSWVEVFFSGVGWVAFDPTPPRTSAPALPAGTAQPLRPAGRGGDTGATGTGAHPAPHALARVRHRGGGGLAWWGLAALSALGVALLGAAAWWIAAAARLRRGLAGDGSGAVAELGAALAQLAPAGARRPDGPADTLAALERRLATTRGGRASAYLRDLRGLRYGRPGPAPGPSARGRRELRRALADGAGLRTRLRALLALPPGAARRLQDASEGGTPRRARA